MASRVAVIRYFILCATVKETHQTRNTLSLSHCPIPQILPAPASCAWAARRALPELKDEQE